MTGVSQPNSARSNASSFRDPPQQEKFDGGHEFNKALEEALELERIQEAADLEELKHKVFADQWEAEKQAKIDADNKLEEEKFMTNYHRPVSVHTIRSKTSEELAESKLLLPRGLKFRPLITTDVPPPKESAHGTDGGSSNNSVVSGGSGPTGKAKHAKVTAKTLKLDAQKALQASMLLPKSLLDASKTIKKVEKYAPSMMQEITYDLEVLLGNKCALGADKAEKYMNSPEAAASKTAVGRAKKLKIVDSKDILANEVGVDLGKRGARFGGGAAGRPIPTVKKQKDILAALGDKNDMSKSPRPCSPETSIHSVQLPEEDGNGGKSISSRLLGLPGHLSMNVAETEKYFGEQSRVNFADRYHWMSSQRKNTNFANVPSQDQFGNAVTAGKQRTLIFEQGGPRGADYGNADIPFAPIRSLLQDEGPHSLDSSRFPSLGSVGSSTLGDFGTMADTGDAKDPGGIRGASRGGRGGMFTRGGVGAGADTSYFDATPKTQHRHLGYSTMADAATAAASNKKGIPDLSLPISPVGSPATGTRPVPALQKMGTGTDDNIISPDEIAAAHTTPGYKKALQGTHTASAHIAVNKAADKKEMEMLETLHSFDKMLEATDFISHDLAEHTVMSAKELEYHFRGVKSGDYSCLGGGKTMADGSKSHYRYVSVHAPKYAPMPVENSDDDEEDEGPYAFPKKTQTGKKKKKKKNSQPTAMEVLQVTERQDAIAMEQEMDAIALQRKIFIDTNHEDIPGYAVPNASVNSSTHVDDAGNALSPRSMYIDACMREGINPRASLVLRRGMTKMLDLSHHGIGDTMGKVLSECILSLPYLQSINLADNTLTDASLGPLVAALVQMPNILHADLSNNVVGDVASNTLSTYLGTEICPLVKLVMRNADVDDFECTRFITAIKENKETKLQELDLTQNLLGSAEQLNVVMPELTTAGEAFAELIETDNCQLSRLELGWNMIRGDSAIAFAVSLSMNQSITFLDISYNAFGKDGGRELGRALLGNKTLTHLDVSANNIEGTAIFCICVGLIENKIMRKLILDGNPIGSLGAKAVMQVPTMLGSRVKVSVNKCNIAIPAEASENPFMFENLLREYNLDMTDPYDRAQSFMLLYLIACHHTYVITSWQWEESKGHVKSYDLVPFLNPDKQDYFTAKQKEIEIALETTIRAASDVSLAIQFFNEIDVDGSGELDREEFKLLMVKIGIDLDEERLEDVFDTYDTDQGGTIGVDEFLVFLKRQKVETESRLYDLTQTPAFCEKKDLEFNKKGNVMKTNAAGGLDIMLEDGAKPKEKAVPKKRYVPPKTGKLIINIEDSFKRKAIFRTITNTDKEFIEDIAKGATDTVSMTTFGVVNSKLRLDEALALYHTMALENSSKPKILAKILPQLSNASDARLLVTKVLKNDRQEMLALKQTLGVAVRPLLGMCNGFYELDMSIALDRLCLMRLLEMSSNRAILLRGMKKNPLTSKGGREFDSSQKKNRGSCFRNETFKGHPVVVDTKFATPLPRNGILCFDFSGGELPDRDDMLCSDQRVVKILNNLHLLPARYCDDALQKLERYKHLTTLTTKGNGETIYEAKWARGMAIGENMSEFYNAIPDRAKQMNEAKEEEEIKTIVSLRADHFEKCSPDDVCEMIAGGLHYVNWAKDPCHGQGSLNKHHGHHHSDAGSGPVVGLETDSVDSNSTAYPGNLQVGSLDLASISSSQEGYVGVDGKALLDQLRGVDAEASVVTVEVIPEKWVVRISNMSLNDIPQMKDEDALSKENDTKLDPFLMFILGDAKFCTRFIPNECNPKWHKDNYNPDQKQHTEAHVYFDWEGNTDYIDLIWDPSPKGSMVLMIKAMDHDFHSAPDSIGKLLVDLNDHKSVLESAEPARVEMVPLELQVKLPKGAPQPTISFDMRLLEVSCENPETGYGGKLADGTIVEGLGGAVNGNDMAGGNGEGIVEQEPDVAWEEEEEESASEGEDEEKSADGERPVKIREKRVKKVKLKDTNTSEIKLENRYDNDKFTIRYRNIMLSPAISKKAKAIRIMEILDDSFSKLWLLCRQVAVVLEVFQFIGGAARTANFGSYRSDLVCLLYERIVDIHNFELVLRILEPFEVAAITCRIGWLNFYNVLKPEGAIQLNLGRYEERCIAKMLCVLAVTEPGNNWTEYSFRWKSEDECVPGWELTEGWVKQDGKDEGMPNRGILSLYYYSGEGQRLQGCKPHISLRKALMSLTFLSEWDIKSDDEWGVPMTKAARKELYEKGAKYMVNNPTMFKMYAFVDNGRY